MPFNMITTHDMITFLTSNMLMLPHILIKGFCFPTGSLEKGCFSYQYTVQINLDPNPDLSGFARTIQIDLDSKPRDSNPDLSGNLSC